MEVIFQFYIKFCIISTRSNQIFYVLSILLAIFLLKIILHFNPSICYVKAKHILKMSGGDEKIYFCNFEIFGRVQGVFFRKYTETKAKELELRGWCMNTDVGTVKGQIEGPLNQMNAMREWLRTTGSPQSVIDKAVFSDLKEIPSYTFEKFVIRR